VVVLRATKLTDETHIELARKFGELDDVKPYVAAGRKNRLKYDELFDVSNIEPDGSIVDPNSPRGQANKVFKHWSRPFLLGLRHSLEYPLISCVI
jgi:alpha-ketoglutarate-dependent 2,4-dichlorophenoxyacetate dioxygenase